MAFHQYMDTNNHIPQVFVWSSLAERILAEIAKCIELSDGPHQVLPTDQRGGLLPSDTVARMLSQPGSRCADAERKTATHLQVSQSEERAPLQFASPSPTAAYQLRESRLRYPKHPLMRRCDSRAHKDAGQYAEEPSVGPGNAIR